MAFALLGALCAGGFARERETASAEKPVRYVVGISPFLEKEVKDEVYRRVVGLLLEEMPLNSSLWLYDAYHIRTITQVEVPAVRAFASGKTRANQFGEQIRKLREFLAAKHERPEVAGLELKEAVRLPQFMSFVGENLVGGNHSVVVIILGSPLYLDAKEPGFSMAHGYFPSDGHLMAGLEESVYGLKNRAGALREVRVHFGYFGDPWVSEIHREKIGRFWTLYLEGQGALLETFTGDLPTVFNAVRSGSPALARNERHQINPAERKIEMLRITRDVGVADWITREIIPGGSQVPPTSTVGPMKIGIRWQGDIDLDLYATPRAGAETLFFEHTRIPEGYYFKDHRSSPEREYEFIEFERPVDVWQAEARINFYEGHALGGASGEIRIEFEGRIYSANFSLAAERGNKGREGRSQGEFWTAIDIPGILKLRTTEAAQRR